MAERKNNYSPQDPSGYEGDISNLVSLYMFEMGTVPIIPSKHIQTLCIKIQERKSILAGNSDPNGLDGESKLTVSEGSLARDFLINSFRPLVVKVAESIRDPYNTLLDKISAGNIGLITSVDNARPELSDYFLKHAAWWIRQTILEDLGTYTPLCLKPKAYRKLRKLVAISRQMEIEQGYEPSMEDIAKKVGIAPKTVSRLMNASSHIFHNRLSYKPHFVENYLPENEILGVPQIEECIETLKDGSVINQRQAHILKLNLGIASDHRHDFEEIVPIFINGHTHKFSEDEIRHMFEDVINQPNEGYGEEPTKAHIKKLMSGTFEDRSYTFAELAPAFRCSPESLGQSTKPAINKLRSYVSEIINN